MLPYWLLFTVFAAGALQTRKSIPNFGQAAPILAAAGVFLTLMIGLRYEVGGDWVNYLRLFENYSYHKLGQVLAGSDPGYAFLNWIVYSLGLEIWAVNLVCGAIFVWGLIRFAKVQPNPWLAVLVAIPYLTLVVAMGYTRQGVAIGILMAGLATLGHSSIVRFAVYVVFAATFHKSAVIVLPLIAVGAVQHRFVTGAILFATGLLLYYLFIDTAIDRMMTNYVDAEMASQGAAIRVAMNLPPAILFLLFQNRFGLPELQRKLWRNASLAAFLMLAILMLTSATTVVDRIALYLIPLQILVLSRLPHAFPDKGRVNVHLILLVIAYSALIQFVWLNYAVHAGDWLPYRVYPLFESNTYELPV